MGSLFGGSFFIMFTPQEFRDFFKRDFPYCPFVVPEPPPSPPEEEEELPPGEGGEESPEVPDEPIDPEEPDPEEPEEPESEEPEPEEQVSDECVSTSDIERAICDAERSFNANCLDAKSRKVAMLYLTAHFLVLNLKLGSEGVSSQGGYGEASQSVGSVSVSYNAAPDYVKNNPFVNSLMKTGYGQRYFEMAYNCMLKSRIFIVKGRTVH